MFKKIILIAVIFFSIILLGCGSGKNTVQIGDKVTLTYSINFEDGSVFNTASTIETNIGDGAIVKGVEESIIGLKSGDKKEILVAPENGYGKNYDAAKVQKITKMIFDRMGLKPEIGKSYKIGDLEGIIKSTQGSGDFQVFMLDTNPRNTYENLIFKIKIDKITK
ncbi:MAG: FKBP-type peptidyl-prolyl cis-trans isomerase [Candidatus Absconditicoccaceae bacterium]